MEGLSIILVESGCLNTTPCLYGVFTSSNMERIFSPDTRVDLFGSRHAKAQVHIQAQKNNRMVIDPVCY
jgi:hypothetical protein